MLKKYVVIRDFKGSTTGMDVIQFKKDQVVDELIMGSDLIDVALKEKWIKSPTVNNKKAVKKR